MTDRPILYQPAMVRACLANRKTQTRRLFKPQPVEHPTDGSCRVMGHMGPTDYLMREIAPKHWVKTKPSDRLWVREKWTARMTHGWTIADARSRMFNQEILYAADGVESIDGWWPSIHMPREFSRLTQVVTEVRVQRLHDITKADAIAEGIQHENVIIDIKCYGGSPIEVYADRYWNGTEEDGHEGHEDAVDAYAALWDHINGAGAWDANPWVSATTFTNHHRNIDALEAQEAA